MAAKRNRDFRVQQVEAMWARKKRVDTLWWPLVFGGLAMLLLAISLGVSAFGILAFATAVACLGPGIGYALERGRLMKSIEAAEAKIDEIDAEAEVGAGSPPELPIR